MDCCNAYSMSCTTGIPRETVRRKVAELKKRGWVEDVPKQGLRITKACADHFGEDYSLRFLNGLLRASRIIEQLLSDDEKGERPQPDASLQRKSPIRKSRSKAKPVTQTKKKKA